MNSSTDTDRSTRTGIIIDRLLFFQKCSRELGNLLAYFIFVAPHKKNPEKESVPRWPHP